MQIWQWRDGGTDFKPGQDIPHRADGERFAVTVARGATEATGFIGVVVVVVVAVFDGILSKLVFISSKCDIGFKIRITTFGNLENTSSRY